MSQPMTKKQLNILVNKLAAFHYRKLNHDGYVFCKCELAETLREMTELARRKTKSGVKP